MSLRREFLRAEARKLAFVAALFVALQFLPRIQKALLSERFSSPAFDFAYVLFVSFLPSIIYSIISFTIFSFVLSIVKMQLLPAAILEKKYFGLKDRNIKAVLFYAAVLMLVLYDPDHLNTDSTVAGIFSNLQPSLPNAALDVQSITSYAVYLLYLLFIAPLYVLFPLKTYSVVAGALFALFLVHIMSVRIISRKAMISRSIAPRILEEGGWTSATTKISSALPVLSHVSISQEFRRSGVIKKKTERNESDFLGMHVELENKYCLRKGVYSADVAELWVATPPFFSRVYRASESEAGATVIPKSVDLSMFRAAHTAFEARGSIISSRMMNSSSDFAGIKEYVPGDQLNRVWWMGLAKTGTLLTKSFYSTGEDSIILMPDLSDPDAEKEYCGALINSLTNIVNICSKKDISVSIYPICKHRLRAEPTRNKRELMFFILNLNAITLISPEGADAIFDTALTHEDYRIIRERAKKENITLSSLYGASGFYAKASPLFSWERKSVFLGSARDFFRHESKRSKAILITDKRIPSDALLEFRSMCMARKFRYIVILLGKWETRKDAELLDALRQQHIFAVPLAYSDAQKISAVYGILGARIL